MAAQAGCCVRRGRGRLDVVFARGTTVGDAIALITCEDAVALGVRPGAAVAGAVGVGAVGVGVDDRVAAAVGPVRPLLVVLVAVGVSVDVPVALVAGIAVGVFDAVGVVVGVSVTPGAGVVGVSVTPGAGMVGVFDAVGIGVSLGLHVALDAEAELPSGVPVPIGVTQSDEAVPTMISAAWTSTCPPDEIE